MQYYKPMAARVTMGPARPDLAIGRAEFATGPAGEPVDERMLDDASKHGLDLFRSGRRSEAMPFLERGAQDGDCRAQYVYATALFNGDNVPRDTARAFDLMQRASDGGLSQATESLARMRAIAPSTVLAEVDSDAGVGALMSDDAIARCRAMIAEMPDDAPLAVYPVKSLAAMAQALLVTELRDRLETLLPNAIGRAVAAAQLRPSADRS